MAATESKCELFIGCVVWRKKHTASSSVAKKSESKSDNSQSEQLQKSLPDSLDVQTVCRSSLSSVKDAQALPSAKPSSVDENKGIKDKGNTGVDNPSSNTISLPTSTCLKKPSSPAGQRGSVPSQTKAQVTPWQVLNSRTCCAGAEPARENMELPKSSLSLPSNTSSQQKPFDDDDDDLPEYDFGNAGAISKSLDRKSSEAHVDNRNRAEDGSENLTGYLAHSVPISKPTEAPPHREVSVHGPPVPLSRQMEGRHAYHSHCTQPAHGTHALPKIPIADSGKKRFFDDDDDMPEWLPPDLKQPFAKRSNIPAGMPQPTTNPGFKNLPFHHHPPRPLPPLPAPAPRPPMFSSLAVPPMLHPPFNSKVPPPVPSRDRPSYMTGFTFNPVLQPPSGPLAVRSPLQPAGGVWRP